MGTLTVYATDSAKIKSAYPYTHFDTGTTETDTESQIFFYFGGMPDAIKYKYISNVKFYLYGGDAGDYGYYISTGYAKEPFDPETVTYADRPSFDYRSGISSRYDAYGYSNFYRYLTALIYGAFTEISRGILHTEKSSNKPYLLITYDDTTATPTIKNCAPSSGYVPKTAANTFSWGIGTDIDCYGTYAQTAATFEWRVDSGSTATSISCGTNQYCTVPANTFTTDSIQWRVTVTTDGGTVTSNWYTLSTVEATSTATAVSPKNTVVDASATITFSWEHIISTGTVQTAYDIQYSTDGSTYSALSSGSTADTSVEIAAGTFSAGTIYWKVRTYNTDDVAGEWSDVVQFLAIAAPSTPVVSISTNSPRAVFTWQATGQQAYQYAVDDEFTSEVIFGTSTSARCPYFLTDGRHTIKVRIQNKYSLWSEWGTVSLTVANTADSDITLSVTSDHAARLSWETEGGYTKYYVYRAGEPIANVTDKSYVDNLLDGEKSYFVIGAYDDSDNYGKSNTITVALAPDYLMIADADTFAWQALKLSESDTPTLGLSLSRQITSTYYTGAAYPSAELSEFYSKSLTFATAFKNKSDADLFKDLIGKIVCVKTTEGDCVVGVLAELARTSNPMYRAFSCKVSQIDYPEVIDLD